MMRRSERDRGTVLILTLVLTVILAVVVVALATYVATGLRTSDTTDLRSETNADGGAALTWAMEEFRTGGLVLAACDGVTDLAPPSVVLVNGSSVEIFCTSDAPLGSFPVVNITATATKDGVAREVKAVAQYSSDQLAVRALDWSVDDVPLAP